MNNSIRILIGLGVGLFAGILHSINSGQILPALPELIEPIGTLWVNAIRMTVIPLVASLLITSIAGNKQGDLITKLGGKTIGLLVLMILAVCLFTIILSPLFLSFLHINHDAAVALRESTGAAASIQELPPFRDWFIKLIPTNPLKAASDSDMLPLLVFTSLFSLALLKIKAEESKVMIQFFIAIKEAMFVLIEWIMIIAPLGVFALVFPLAAKMGMSTATILGSFILITCGLITLLTILLYPLATLFGKLTFLEFARLAAPAQIIGFSTRSSVAALPTTFAATNNLKINHEVSGLVLPIAVSLFRFASPLARTTGTYFIAILYGIDLSTMELLVIVLVIGLLSFYSPGIPSSGLFIMTPVYQSLGLPVAGIGILIAVDLIVDMFLTASNVTANITVAALLTRNDRK
ncbi:MAG: dicarboxylate/amino acid:cation symporter [Gammaproteobacteria bacterium]|nr:dicarboxylate/amino acid:cation symporter [Gammaproteobacteria bacterium]